MKYSDFDKNSYSYIVVFHDDREKIIKWEGEGPVCFEDALETNGLQYSDIKEAYGITPVWSK